MTRPASCSPTSTSETITAYIVASRPAHITSPHTTWVSSTWVVSCPSHVFWKCMRMKAPNSDWKIAVMKVA